MWSSLVALVVSAPPAPGLLLLASPAGSTYASDASADGAVVVGQLSTPEGKVSAFRWTEASGVVDLGDFPGGLDFGSAEGVSADGASVVGIGYREDPSGADASGLEAAFRWSAASGLVDLGELPGGLVRALAIGVSDDGAAAAGASYDGRNDFVACRFAAGAVVSLGTLPGSTRSSATAISGDGETVVGTADGTIEGVGVTLGWRWSAAGGMVKLPDLPGGLVYSSPYDASADGAIIVGGSGSIASGEEQLEAFRYDVATDHLDALGDLPGGSFGSEALAVSSDGKVVVGRSVATDDGSEEAFVWTARLGMRRLTEVAATAGIAVPEGVLLSQATGISGDGLAIVGNALTPDGVSAFRLVLPASVLPRDPEVPGGDVPELPDAGTTASGDDGCAGGGAGLGLGLGLVGAAFALGVVSRSPPRLRS